MNTKETSENRELTAAELDAVSGGKANVSDISITKFVDKSSTELFLASAPAPAGK